MSNMLSKRGCRISTTLTRINQKYISTYFGTVDILGACVRVLTKGNNYIHGPTAEDVSKDIDLGDKTCLITGGNSGIGLEMVKCLVAQKCKVLMACRNPYAARVVTKNFCANNELRIYETNLASLASVKRCCDKILKDQKQIDIVILNAGVFGLPWTLTEDGLETIFQVNYLSQYYLLTCIEELLAPDARVVFLSSESHRNVKWTLENQSSPTADLISLPKDQFTSIKAYNTSKLCGLLTMHYLGYRWLKTGKSVFCAHPGIFVKTNLCQNWWVYEAFYTVMLPFSKNVYQAASTPLYCAISPELSGLSAMYYKNCQQHEENELARDFHLAFRINDLTRTILRERAESVDEVVKEPKTIEYEDRKDIIDEHLMTDLSS